MKEKASTGGIGFLGLLTLLFIALKLTGYITWSWWWILFPIWGVCVFFIIIVVACSAAVSKHIGL